MHINVATSPVFNRGNQSGLAYRAVVLRGVMNQDGQIVKWVVHDRYVYEDGGDTYGNGDYFLNRLGDTTNAFDRAYARWIERCRVAGEDRLAPLAVVAQATR